MIGTKRRAPAGFCFCHFTETLIVMGNPGNTVVPLKKAGGHCDRKIESKPLVCQEAATGANGSDNHGTTTSEWDLSVLTGACRLNFICIDS